MKRIFKIIVCVTIAVVVGLIVFSFIAEPFFRCRSLRNSILAALDNASSVRVVEHSSPWDDPELDRDTYRETIYSTIVLNADQTKLLRKSLPYSLDYSDSIFKSCIFDEHHRVEIPQREGKPFILHICFHCGEIVLNNESQRIMPQGWRSSLSSFMGNLGLHPDGPFEKR